MIVLLPLGIFALVATVLVLVAWGLDSWLIALVGIPLVAVLGELVWRNWWGDRWLRERLLDREANPS
jgi:hypothetical protein